MLLPLLKLLLLLLPQLGWYFQEPEDLELIHVLLTAAQLVHGAGGWGAGGSRGGSGSTAAGAGADPWLPVYAHESAQACLQVLAAWLPDALASGFTQHHQVRLGLMAAYQVMPWLPRAQSPIVLLCVAYACLARRRAWRSWLGR